MVLRTFYAFPALQSSLVSQRKHSKMKARTGGPEGVVKKRGRLERGRESLVKWNLVTDATGGGGGGVVCLRVCALMHAHGICVCELVQE